MPSASIVDDHEIRELTISPSRADRQRSGPIFAIVIVLTGIAAGPLYPTLRLRLQPRCRGKPGKLPSGCYRRPTDTPGYRVDFPRRCRRHWLVGGLPLRAAARLHKGGGREGRSRPAHALPRHGRFGWDRRNARPGSMRDGRLPVTAPPDRVNCRAVGLPKRERPPPRH